jgi:hypothetical protein
MNINFLGLVLFLNVMILQVNMCSAFMELYILHQMNYILVITKDKCKVPLWHANIWYESLNQIAFLVVAHIKTYSTFILGNEVHGCFFVVACYGSIAKHENVSHVQHLQSFWSPTKFASQNPFKSLLVIMPLYIIP